MKSLTAMQKLKVVTTSTKFFLVHAEIDFWKSLTLCTLIFAFTSTAYAAEINAKIIHVFKVEFVGGKYHSREIVAGVNMGGSTDDCQQMIGKIKVEGVQFSQSGVTLESFRFTDKNDAQWSIPTGFSQFSNVERRKANNFIKVGKSYFVQVEICGNGGYPDLINMYDDSIGFGTK